MGDRFNESKKTLTCRLVLTLLVGPFACQVKAQEVPVTETVPVAPDGAPDLSPEQDAFLDTLVSGNASDFIGDENADPEFVELLDRFIGNTRANDEALAVLDRLPSTDPSDIAEVEALLEGLADGDERARRTLVALFELAAGENTEFAGEDSGDIENIDIRDAFAERARIANLASQFQALSVFNITPGITSSRLTFDDPKDLRITLAESEVSSIKVPLKRNFNSATFCVGKGSPVAEAGFCATPYAELTLGYLRNRSRGSFGLVINDVGVDPAAPGTDIPEDLLILLPPDAFLPLATGESSTQNVENSPVRSTVETFSVLSGFGLSIPVTRNVVARPIVLGGYSYISDETRFSGDFAAFNEALAENAGFNVDLSSALFGGALELVHETAIGDSLGLRSRLRYNHLFSHVFDASDDVLERTNQFSVATADVEATVPTGYSIFGSDIDLIGTTGLFYLKEGGFFENDSNVTDRFDANLLAQVGGGLQFSTMAIEGVGVRGSYIFGENVEGWKVGVNAKF